MIKARTNGAFRAGAPRHGFLHPHNDRRGQCRGKQRLRIATRCFDGPRLRRARKGGERHDRGHDNRQGGEMARARRSLARPSQHISRPVSRVLYGAGEPARDGHSSGTPVARRLKQPTRTAGGDIRLAHRLRDAPRRPYSVLLPVGLAVPPLLPAARCALTTPFHPYLTSRRPRAVCFLWRFPWGRPRRTLSGTACPWSPDFPPARPFGACASGRPAD